MKGQQNASPQKISRLIRSRCLYRLFPPRQLHNLRNPRHRLHNQRPFQNRLQQVFPSSHSCRRSLRILQPWRPHDQRIHGSLHLQCLARLHAAFPQHSSQSQHSRHRAHRLLLFLRQPPEPFFFCLRLLPTVISHHHPKQFPLRLGPSHRQRQLPQKFPRCFLG